MPAESKTYDIAALDAGGPLPPHAKLGDYYADETGRRRLVSLCFDTSAEDYDRVNAMFSFGSGQLYRAWTLRRFGLRPGERLLDVGSGTGVLAASAQRIVGNTGLVVSLDPSLNMLARAGQRGVGNLVPGRAERLPFADASFDRLTMGYALRHVADLGSTFREYVRVLAPGGSLMLLELTRPASRLGRDLLNLHMNGLIPLLSRFMGRARQTAALMRYSWETVEHSLPPQAILGALRGAGLEQVRRNSWFSIFSEYTAIKPVQSCNVRMEQK